MKINSESLNDILGIKEEKTSEEKIIPEKDLSNDEPLVVNLKNSTKQAKVESEIIEENSDVFKPMSYSKDIFWKLDRFSEETKERIREYETMSENNGFRLSAIWKCSRIIKIFIILIPALACVMKRWLDYSSGAFYRVPQNEFNSSLFDNFGFYLIAMATILYFFIPYSRKKKDFFEKIDNLSRAMLALFLSGIWSIMTYYSIFYQLEIRKVTVLLTMNKNIYIIIFAVIFIIFLGIFLYFYSSKIFRGFLEDLHGENYIFIYRRENKGGVKLFLFILLSGLLFTLPMVHNHLVGRMRYEIIYTGDFSKAALPTNGDKYMLVDYKIVTNVIDDKDKKESENKNKGERETIELDTSSYIFMEKSDPKIIKIENKSFFDVEIKGK